MNGVRKVYVTTVGRVLGESGCESEGHPHEWTIESRDGREVWLCVRCGDEDWVYTEDERASIIKRFPWLGQ
jgi:Zn-finger protein